MKIKIPQYFIKNERNEQNHLKQSFYQNLIVKMSRQRQKSAFEKVEIGHVLRIREEFCRSEETSSDRQFFSLENQKLKLEISRLENLIFELNESNKELKVSLKNIEFSF